VPKQHADFSYLKSDNARSTLPVPGKLKVVQIMAGLLARDSSSRRLPSLPTSDVMPFVLAYSGGSAGELLDVNVTPLPYQARMGTVIEYSVVMLRCIYLFSSVIAITLFLLNLKVPRIAITHTNEISPSIGGYFGLSVFARLPGSSKTNRPSIPPCTVDVYVTPDSRKYGCKQYIFAYLLHSTKRVTSKKRIIPINSPTGVIKFH